MTQKNKKNLNAIIPPLEWDTSGQNIINPSAEEIANGFVTGTVPQSGVFNALLANTSQLLTSYGNKLINFIGGAGITYDDVLSSSDVQLAQAVANYSAGTLYKATTTDGFTFTAILNGIQSTSVSQEFNGVDLWVYFDSQSITSIPTNPVCYIQIDGVAGTNGEMLKEDGSNFYIGEILNAYNANNAIYHFKYNMYQPPLMNKWILQSVSNYLGCVKVSSTDLTAGKLSDKIIAGDGISISVLGGAGTPQQLQVSNGIKYYYSHFSGSTNTSLPGSFTAVPITGLPSLPIVVNSATDIVKLEFSSGLSMFDAPGRPLIWMVKDQVGNIVHAESSTSDDGSLTQYPPKFDFVDFVSFPSEASYPATVTLTVYLMNSTSNWIATVDVNSGGGTTCLTASVFPAGAVNATQSVRYITEVIDSSHGGQRVKVNKIIEEIKNGNS